MHVSAHVPWATTANTAPAISVRTAWAVHGAAGRRRRHAKRRCLLCVKKLDRTRHQPDVAARALTLIVAPDDRAAPAEVEWARHAPALRAAAGVLCRNAAECDDLVQDTFERALRYLAGGRQPVVNLRSWLVAILRNAFIDHVRAERAPADVVEDCPAPEPDPQPPWASVTLSDVRVACAAIDPDLRAVFELHYLEGLRYRDVAARLSIPENTVASRLFRARKVLRDQLVAMSNEETPGEERARTRR